MKEIVRRELLEYTQAFPVYSLGEIETTIRSQVIDWLGNNPDVVAKLTISKAARSKFGDLTIPCFQLARLFGRNPVVVASELARRLSSTTQIDDVSGYEPDGSFVNIRLNYDVFGARVLENVVNSNMRYGSENLGHGANLLVDMSSPNMARRMTVGCLRSTIIGDSIARILRFNGFSITRDNHLGDWGMKFGHLLNGVSRFGNMEAIKHRPLEELEKIYVRAIKEAEFDENIRERGKETLRKLELGDPELQNLWQRVVDWSLEDYGDIYRMLGVDFEIALRDSFYNPMVTSTLERIKRSGITRENEGAIVVDLSDKDLGIALIQKTNESPSYLAREIATVLYRLEQLKVEGILYVVGNDQTLFFQQLFEVMRRMGYDISAKCRHVAFGMITLPEGKINTLTQKILPRDIIDRLMEKSRAMIIDKSRSRDGVGDREGVIRAIAIGALKWFNLSVDPRQSYMFDWDRMLDLDSNGAVYIQYTHARICSLLKRSAIDPKTNVKGIEHPLEKQLILNIAEFNRVVRRSAEEFNPSYIATYLSDLCHTFNKLYQDLRIVGVSQENFNRLAITSAVRQVIANGLFLLGIDAPQII